MRLLRLSFVLILAAQIVSACQSRDDDDAGTAQQIMDSCTPYNTMDGERHLEVKSRLSGLEKGRLKFDFYVEIGGEHEKTVDAPFTTNNADKTLTLKLKDGDVTYHVVELTDNTCALLSGDPKRANLDESWFGEKDVD